MFVGFAINCLCRIDKAVKELSKESNINLLPAIGYLQAERKRLIKEEPAFKKAEEILISIEEIRGGVK